VKNEIGPGEFEANDPSRRPSFWAEVKLKRVMLKEHIERISGLSEQSIVAQRFMKEVDVSYYIIILFTYICMFHFNIIII
jgi:hypothetical protein